MNEVQYTLTQDDFWHLQLYAFSRRQRRTILLIIILACPFIFQNHPFFGNYIPSIPIVVFNIFLFLFVILLLICLLFLLMWISASRSHKALKKTGVNVLTISEQNVQHSNEISNSTSSWRAYKAIEEDKHNIYFVTDQPGRLFMAILIPKHAFESPLQTEHFIARARSYWQEQAGQVATSHS
jgi:YcxB-like protein